MDQKKGSAMMTKRERSAELCRLTYTPHGFDSLVLAYMGAKGIPLGHGPGVGITTSFMIEEILKAEYPND